MSAAAASAAAVGAVDLQTVLMAPLSLVQRALDTHAAQHPVAANAALEHADVQALHSHLSSSNWGVEEALHELLGLQHKRSDPQCKIAMIPSLNRLSSTRDISHLRPNQLVRFRGMVQETFQPDFFQGLFQEQQQHQQEDKQPQPFHTAHIRTGKYRDVMHVPSTGNEQHESIMERLSLNVVPIPGESEWVREAWLQLEAQSGHAVPSHAPAATATAASAAKKKRGLEGGDEAAPAPADSSMDESGSGSVAAAAAASGEADAAAAAPQKKGKSETAADGSASSGAALPAEHGLEVIVTVYDSLANPAAAASASASAAAAPAAASSSAATAAPAASSSGAPSHALARAPLRVSEAYEFIGVLSLNPDLKAALEGGVGGDDAMDGLGAELWGPRRSKALRMHALAAVKIDPGFPLIADPAADATLFATQRSQLSQVLPGVRASLLAHLSSVLGGDELAAEVLLLFMLQRLHTRGGGVSGRNMLGKLVVNLVAPAAAPGADDADGPARFAAALHAALRDLLPRVAKLDVNIEALNAQPWHPTKNYDDESLDSNLLQLSSPSYLLLDETRLTAGTLSSVGLTNLRVLCKLLGSASLEYDFQYQALDFPVEYAALLLSAGGKTLLSQDGQQAVDVTLKLQPAGGAAALYSRSGAAVPTPSPSVDELNYWRAYLLMARDGPYAIAPHMAKSIEDHFVAMRKARPAATNEATLHLLLNIARLYSLSHGESELGSVNRWNEITNLFERIQLRSS